VSEHKAISVNNLAIGLGVGFGVVAAFIFIVLSITQLGLGEHHEDSSGELRQERIKPVGQVVVEGEEVVVATPAPTVEPAPAIPKSGKEVYESVCMACHAQALLGSPRFGDKEDWGKRYEQGEATLLNHVLNGFGQMPAQGGQQLSDEEVNEGILYMLNAAGLGTTVETETETVVPAEKTPAVVAGKSGKEVYELRCKFCHETGIAGAPKYGDKASWEARIVKEEAVLYQSALNGLNAMPPRGGDSSLSDDEVKEAVQFMLKAVGVESEKEEISTTSPDSETTPAVPEVSSETTEPETSSSEASELDLAQGEQIYQTICTACHQHGIAGSPKLGDNDSWAPRLEKGMDALFTSALQGLGAMPPKGGNISLPDEDIKAAVAYMVSKVSGVAEEVATDKETAPAEEATDAEAATPAETTEVTPPSATETSESESAKSEEPAPDNTEASSSSDKQFDVAKGEEVYKGICFACHATGVAGSPILGNKDSWAPRLEKGMDALFTSVLQGLGAMPPKGGNMSLPDEDIKAAVTYMVSQAQ